MRNKKYLLLVNKKRLVGKEILWLGNESMPRQPPFVAPQKPVGPQAEETAACLILEVKTWSNVSLPSKLINVTILGPKANYTNVLPQPLIKRHVFEIIKMTLMHTP